MVEASNFDALISASTLSLPSFLPLVVPRVGGSRPLVFYSPYKEDLLETQHALTSDKRVLAPSIFESRARVYQTIQGRLHPLMTLRGYGGYVLCGTRVFPAGGHIQAVGKGSRKKPRMEATESKPETDDLLMNEDSGLKTAEPSIEPESRDVTIEPEPATMDENHQMELTE